MHFIDKKNVNNINNICLLQWIANPLNDMYADAVATVVLEVQSNPKAQKRKNENV